MRQVRQTTNLLRGNMAEDYHWLDRENLNDQWQNFDRDTRRDIMAIFIKELGERKQYLENADGLETIRHYAHAIKGSANSVSATKLALWAGRLEEMCESETFHTLSLALKELPDIYENTIREINSYVEES